MPEYRPLTLQELNELEKEFVEYLILNGITADDWVKIKEEEPEHAERIIDLFSDVVFESILRKVEYMEFREKKEVRTYQCLPDKLVVVGMKAENSEADFTDPHYIQKAMQAPPDCLKIYTSEKQYQDPRELEIFRLTEAGCVISDGKLFKTLCLALPR